MTRPQNEVKRDRLSAYVDPDSTKVIDQVKKELYEKNGIRVTIGQAIDYIMRSYKE